jgi:glucokinase
LGCDPARVKLLNDVEATAYGLLFLKPDEWVELNPGAVDSGEGNIAVVAAGTGLGESILYWDGKSHHPMASEGGHCSFAPQSELEVELWRYLRGKFSGHVSYERILSGQGFFDLFDFLAQTGQWPQSDAARQKLQEAARAGGGSVPFHLRGRSRQHGAEVRGPWRCVPRRRNRPQDGGGIQPGVLP